MTLPDLDGLAKFLDGEMLLEVEPVSIVVTLGPESVTDTLVATDDGVKAVTV